MAAFDKDSRIVPPFKPSLSFMCTAKIAIALYSEFGPTPFQDAFPELKFFGLREYKKCRPEQSALLRNRAKERLLLIPTILRKNIFEALERVHYEIIQWQSQHEGKYRRYHEKCTYFWRFDGTIDRAKTAQYIVCNENIDVPARFEMACMYCLVKSVQSLWAILEANGETQRYKRPYHKCYFNAMVHFWVRWLREGAQFHWTQAAHEYLNFRMYIRYPSASDPSFSTLFRQLMPVDRCRFFKDLFLCDDDELRSCLYIVTNKEQEEIMKLYAPMVLTVHTVWPFSSLFLEIAEKSWKFLDPFSFYRMLNYLLDRRDNKDYDYYEYLAMEFWNRSPEDLKEQIRNSTFWVDPRVLKFIKEIKQSRS